MNYIITSATKLSSSNLKAAQEVAKTKLGATGTPKLEVDPSLIAGVRILYGSMQLDLSLSARIDSIKSSIS